MSIPIFYYWIKNIITGEEKQITVFCYSGDVDEFLKDTNDWIITDWTYEMQNVEEAVM